MTNLLCSKGRCNFYLVWREEGSTLLVLALFRAHTDSKLKSMCSTERNQSHCDSMTEKLLKSAIWVFCRRRIPDKEIVVFRCFTWTQRVLLGLRRGINFTSNSRCWQKTVLGTPAEPEAQRIAGPAYDNMQNQNGQLLLTVSNWVRNFCLFARRITCLVSSASIERYAEPRLGQVLKCVVHRSVRSWPNPVIFLS